MSILGIESLNYGVDDVVECTRFFVDFGLPLRRQDAASAEFRLEDGSRVVIRHRGDASLPQSSIVGTGVREVVWAVDNEASLERLATELARDRSIRRDADGALHCLADDGLPIAFRIFAPKALTTALDPVNAPGRIERLNQHRKWLVRARPKRIAHVVYAVKDPEASSQFFRKRLGFRLSDKQRGYGVYTRCDGTLDHHNIFFLNAALPFPGLDGEVRFHHANFAVADLDEMMLGANHMLRNRWPKSHFGLGRHRVDSALFYYLPCPTGGEAEYGADSDALDEAWVPREFVNPVFGYVQYMHNLPDFLLEAPPWEVRYLTPEEQGS